tara:strand:- start:1013 stop:1531 length:519 start_codon:yes stop_codon:yes gene_type:complete
MISNFKQPDLNAPRYREKVFSILNTETLKEFKDKYPVYKNINDNKLKKVIKLFNENIWKEVIENRNGVELPDSLGYLFIGTCPASKSVNTNYALSKQYGKVLQNKNWETDGKVAKIFYTNYSTKYRFRNRELWQFKAVRQFKRAVAKSYPKKWNKYIIMDNKKRVAEMYKNK